MTDQSPFQHFLGKSFLAIIDRPSGTKHPKHGFLYPVNYGFIPDVFSGDGEELDGYILGIDHPLETFFGECIAIIHRLNDDDDKLVLAPPGAIFNDDQIRKLTHFQEQWFESVILRAF